MLSINHLMDSVQGTYCMDNEALYNICRRTISTPEYSDLNHLVANTMSGLTATLRFPNKINTNYHSFCQNMASDCFLKCFVFTNIGSALFQVCGFASITTYAVCAIITLTRPIVSDAKCYYLKIKHFKEIAYRTYIIGKPCV